MKKNFTQLISEFSQIRQFTIATSTLFLLLVTAVYLRAAVGITVTGGNQINISADLAKDSKAPTVGGQYTTLGPINFKESTSNDEFGAGSKTIELNAPAGWEFFVGSSTTSPPYGITIAANQISTGSQTIAASITNITASKITITYTGAVTNKQEEITVSGIRIIAVSGVSAPETVTITAGGELFATPVNVLSINHTHGAARKLVFATQPGGAFTGVALNPQPQVVIQDQFGNTATTVTGSNASVTVAIGNNAAGNGVLGGTKIVNAVNGVATFSGLSIDAAGEGYTLTATYGTLTATSAAFNVDSKTPNLTSVSPACITAGAGNTEIVVTGTNFEKNSIVRIGNTDLTTTFLSSTSLKAVIPASELQNPSSQDITVLNPIPPANNTSNAVKLTIGLPVTFNASLIDGEREVCAGKTVVYTAPEGYANYDWSVSPGGAVKVVSSGNKATVTYEPITSGSITILATVTNSCSATGTVSFNVNVLPLPSAKIEYEGDPVICAGGSKVIKTSSAPAGETYTYQWELNGTVVGTDSPELTATEAGEYRVIVTGNNGCPKISDPVTLTIEALPNAPATTSNERCGTGAVDLFAAGAPTGGSYRWYTTATGGEAIPLETDGAFTTPLLTATTTYYVATVSKNGCESSTRTAVTATINPIPAEPAVTPGAVCESGSVTLSATVGTNGTIVKWYNAAGSVVGTGATYQTPILTSSTDYFASSYNENTKCESAKVPVRATVNPLPIVSITAPTASEFCSSDAATTLAGSPSGSGGSFRILEGSTTRVNNATTFDPVALGAGTYTIEYSYTDGNKCTAIATKTVTVKQQPTVSVTPDLAICAGESATLTASGATTYTWSPATGLSATTGATVTANPTATTTYTVIGTTNGCQSVAKTVKVTVNPLPTATITVTGPSNFCAGSSVVLNAPDAPAGSTYAYEWTFTDEQGQASVSAGKTLSVSESGSAVVKVTNTATGCEKVSDPVELRRGTLEFAIFSYTGSTTFCDKQELKLTAIQAPEGQTYVYRWLKDNGTTTPEVVSTERVYIAKNTGVYRVEITETSIEPNCVKTSNAIQITVNPLPTANAGADLTECFTAGGTVFTLNGAVTDANGVWSVVAGSQTGTAAVSSIASPNALNSKVTVTGVGTVTLRLTANSNATPACTSATDEVVLKVNALPSAAITAGGPTTFCQTGSVVLSAPVGNYSYQWFNKGTAIGGATSQQYTASVAGDYTVRVTDNVTTCAATTATPTVVTVNPQPVVSAASSPDPDKCIGDGGKTVFSLTGAVTNGTPEWSVVGTTGDATVATNDIETPNATSTNVTVTGAGTVTMRLTASSTVASCNDAYKEITLTVYPMPIANAGPDQALCQTTSGTTFFWREGSGSGSEAGMQVKWTLKSKDARITSVGIGYDWLYKQRVDIVGVGNVTLTMTVTTNGCSTSDDVTYTVKPRPVVTAIENKTYCNGANIEGIAFESDILGSTFSWTSNKNVGFGLGGDGNIGAFTATNDGTAPVTATVTVTATKDACAGQSKSFTITVNPTPKLSSSLTPPAICSGSQFNYTPASATPGATFTWSRAAVGGNAAASGNGSISEVLTNTSTAPIPVTYTITTSANDCTGETQNVVVTVNPRPVLNSPLTATVCSGTLFTYTPGSATTGATFSWTRAAVPGISNAEVTTPRSGGISETLVNTTAAAIQVTYVYTTIANGCAGEPQNLVVTVNPKPVLSSTLSPAAICSGSTFTYTPTSQTSNYSYTWTRIAPASITSTGGTSGTGPSPISQVLTNTTASPVNVTYRITLSANGCSGNTQDVVVTVNPTPRLSSSLTPAAVCSGSAFSYTAASATQNTTFSWSRAAVAGISNPAVSNVAGNVINETLTNTTASAINVVYAVTMTANGCTNTQNVTVSVKPKPQPTFTGVTDGQIFYSGDGNVTLTGQNPANGTFSGLGITNNVFSPCSALAAGPAGATEISVPITYTVTVNGCTGSITKTVKVKKTTYKVVVTADPFPICRGQNTLYTAKIYRDATVIYPYLANEFGQPVDGNGNVISDAAIPTVNMAYFAAKGIDPATVPSIIVANAWRFYQPIVQGGTLVNSFDITEATKSSSYKPTQAEYKWTKNDSKPNNGISGNSPLYSQSGLSSTDWYAVQVTSIGGTTACPSMGTLLSQRMYLSEPDGYSITINPVTAWCGDAAGSDGNVELNAVLGNLPGGWSSADLTYRWYLLRNGTSTPLSDLITYTKDTPVSITLPKSTFLNGDKVYIDFNTNYDTYAGLNSKCLVESVSPQITIRIDQPAAITADLSSEAQTLCAGGTTTFRVNATGTNLQFAWYKTGNSMAITSGGQYTIQSTTTGSTLTITNVGAGDAGGYYVKVSNASSTACATMSLSKTTPLNVNPLPLARNVSGGPFCPITQPNGTVITLENPEENVTYTLTKAGDPSFTPVSKTKADNSGILSFGTFKEGTYIISAVSASSCSNPKVGEATITATPYPILTGELQIYWRENNTKWEVIANSDHIAKGVTLNDKFKYEWYVGASETSAPLFMTTTYPDNKIFIQNPSTDLYVKCIIKAPSGMCLPDVIMDNRLIKPLPVELIYFRAEKQENNVVLTWATASEKDNAGFEVQVSQDGKNYRQLQFVATKNGNTSVKQNYEYVDKENGKYGTRYYRLRQLDSDGTFKYFGPRAVMFGAAGNKVLAYPNPFSKEVNLDVEADQDGRMEIVVTNLLGKQVLRKEVDVAQGKSTIKLEMEAALPGSIYIVTTRLNGHINNFKLLKE